MQFHITSIVLLESDEKWLWGWGLVRQTHFFQHILLVRRWAQAVIDHLEVKEYRVEIRSVVCKLVVLTYSPIFCQVEQVVKEFGGHQVKCMMWKKSILRILIMMMTRYANSFSAGLVYISFIDFNVVS